nr:hypothetical protein [Baekduia soli]
MSGRGLVRGLAVVVDDLLRADRAADERARGHDADGELGDGRAGPGARGDLAPARGRRGRGQARGELDEQRVGRDGRDHAAHRGAGAHEALARGPGADAERGGDLLVRAALELAQHEGGALALGEVVHGGERLAQALRALEGGVRAVGGGGVLGVERNLVADGAQHVQGRVVGDAVQPGAEMTHLVGPRQGVVDTDQGLLDGVLCACRPDDPRAVAQQRGAVAVDDGREGGLVAVDGQLGEPLVALQPQERGARQTRRVAQQMGPVGVRDPVLPRSSVEAHTVARRAGGPGVRSRAAARRVRWAA